jgi:hypothetical protein
VGPVSDLAARIRAAMADEVLRLTELPPWPWKLNAEGDEVLAADDEEICTGWALSSRQQRAVASFIVDQGPQARLRQIDGDRQLLDWLVMCEEKALDNNWWNLEVSDAIAVLAKRYGIEV